MMISVEGAIGTVWRPTNELRWFRPKGATDMEIRLEQAWLSEDGKVEWRQINLVFED